MVDAVVRTIKKFRGEQQAAIDALEFTAPDAAHNDRCVMALKLMQVDGTDELVRHFVRTAHSKLVANEVGKHIDASTLSESDRYRLAAISAVEENILADRIVSLSVVSQARALSMDDLVALIAAFDITAQKKLTEIRLNDDGATDREAGLIINEIAAKVLAEFKPAG